MVVQHRLIAVDDVVYSDVEPSRAEDVITV